MLGVPFLSAAITKLFAQKTITDPIDRLNHCLTPCLLIFFSLTVSAKQYVGTPIQCWVPYNFKTSEEHYVEDLCFIENTYYVAPNEEIPELISERNKRQITYYQWVPIVLMLQAIMFYLPNWIWRSLYHKSGIDIETAVSDACLLRTQHCAEKRSYALDKLVQYLNEVFELHASSRVHRYFWSRFGRFVAGSYVCVLYLFVKLLYLLNVFGQFILLSEFIGHGYIMWGWSALQSLWTGTGWTESPIFPRVTLCDINRRQLGNTNTHTVECVLMINMFNEKIYLFIWFWFLLVATSTLISFVYCLLALIPQVARERQIRILLDQSKIQELFDSGEAASTFRQFVNQSLGADGVLLLRFIKQHAGAVVARDLAAQLFSEFEQHSDVEMSLSKFQLSNQRHYNDLELADFKNLKEVIMFDSTGVFFVVATVAELQYQVYKACPNRPGGVPCRRKLNAEGLCTKCAQKAAYPILNLFVRLLLRDVSEPGIDQRATMFASVAEAFIGLKSQQLTTMGADDLAEHLESKLGTKLCAKVNVKENDNDDNECKDWIIVQFNKHSGEGAEGKKKE